MNYEEMATRAIRCLREILGEKERTIWVPWDKHRRAQFSTRYAAAKGAAFDVVNLTNARQANVGGLGLTRILLTQECLPELPKGVQKAFAVAAYPSAYKYRKDIALETEQRKQAKQEQQETLAFVLSHRFFMPKRSGKSDKELLKQAIA